MNKDLKEKAIDLKGKKYVLVSDRVIYFNEKYPNGRIRTKIVKDDDAQYIVRATVTPDVDNKFRTFNGFAQEVIGKGFVNSTSALENAETSAVGRALAMMGIGVIDSIASIDEINKATNRNKTKEEKFEEELENDIKEEKKENPITEEQKGKIKGLLLELGRKPEYLEEQIGKKINDLGLDEANKIIKGMVSKLLKKGKEK